VPLTYPRSFTLKWATFQVLNPRLCPTPSVQARRVCVCVCVCVDEIVYRRQCESTVETDRGCQKPPCLFVMVLNQYVLGKLRNGLKGGGEIGVEGGYQQVLLQAWSVGYTKWSADPVGNRWSRLWRPRRRRVTVLKAARRD
jgi:hypothetical protein